VGVGIIIGIGVVGGSIAIAVATTRYLRGPRVPWPEPLRQRARALRRRVRALLEAVPASPVPGPAAPAPPGPPTPVAATPLPRRAADAALAAAEQALAAAPEDPATRLALAWALFRCDQLEAAARELERARQLGAAGPWPPYLEGRIRHTVVVRQTNAGNPEILSSPVPALITPFELFVLQLEQQRRQSPRAASVWLAGLSRDTLDAEQILALVTEHFSAYYDALEWLLEAAEAHPGFADALYHVARLSIKVGFIAEGRELFDRLEPLAADADDQAFFRRDLAQLRDEQVAAQVSIVPAISAHARRSSRLRVLSG
jgi:tetratricopeptide (TPR) repeat protein